MIETLRSAFKLLQLSWRQNRFKTAASLVLVMSNALAAPLMALALKWMTNAAIGGDGGTAAVAVVVAGALVASQLLGTAPHTALVAATPSPTLSASTVPSAATLSNEAIAARCAPQMAK